MRRTRYLRLLLLLASLAALGLAGHAVLQSSSSARQIVLTRAPKVGVHTRVTDEVELWKIERTFQMVREMGATWAVEYFPWPYIEPDQGRFDWGHADLVVNTAYAQGITLIARIDSVPDWARPKNTTSRYLDEAHYSDYADFVCAFVQRYKDKVHYYIIWNEPNVAFEWGYRPVSPEAYTDLLRATYPRVKDVDPSAKVIAAGLAPTLEESDMAMSDLSYLQRMYDAGAKDYFDVMSVHAYGWKFPPDDPADLQRINFSRAALTRQVMERNGDSDKPVFITEGGWNDHPRWTKAVRPAQRVEYTVRAYQKVDEEWPWCQVVALWVFRLPAPSHTYNDYATFVNFDFTPKPVYEAVREYAVGH